MFTVIPPCAHLSGSQCHLPNGAVTGNQVEVEGDFLRTEVTVEQCGGGDGGLCTRHQ
jgi:hypothetical protein